MPTSASLAIETKGLLFLWWAHLNNKSNVCNQISSVRLLVVVETGVSLFLKQSYKHVWSYSAGCVTDKTSETQSKRGVRQLGGDTNKISFGFTMKPYFSLSFVSFCAIQLTVLCILVCTAQSKRQPAAVKPYFPISNICSVTVGTGMPQC